MPLRLPKVFKVSHLVAGLMPNFHSIITPFLGQAQDIIVFAII
jgi:hypothetical protein